MVTVKRTFRKTLYREVRQSLSRFLAIFAIVALGVGFLAGLLATTPDMRLSMDRYYDENDLMDLRVVSTLGLTDDDCAVLRETEGVQAVMPAYNTDKLTNIDERADVVTRFHSLPFGQENAAYLNRVQLVDGRLPEKADECVVVTDQIGSTGITPGSVVTVTGNEDEGMLAVKEFTVVGTVHSTYYFSVEKETSSIGTGSVQVVLYVPQEAFSSEVYTEIYLTVNSAKDLLTYSDNYTDVIQPVKDRLKDLSDERAEIRYNDVVGEAQEELDDARQEYNDSKQEADDKLADAFQQLEQARQDIEDGKSALESGRAEWESGKAELQKQKDAYAATIAEKEQEIEDGRAALDEAKNGLALYKQQLDSSKSELDKLEATIAALLEAGLTEQAAQLQPQLESGKTAYAAALKDYEEKAALAQQQENLLLAGEQELADGKKQAEAEFAAAQNKLDDAEAEILSGEEQLRDAERELAAGEAEYEKNKQQADEELQDALEKLNDAQADIDAIEMPEWYVLGRDTVVSYVSFGSNADKVEAIAKVFPVFFFLVAALVALTTMTRMIEEQRTQIGTLKALGYSKLTIAMKYVLYAAAASILGSFFGLVVGFQVFPRVIWGAYDIMYTLPAFSAPFRVPYALISSLAAVVCTLLATVGACYSTLMECPARLMLPRAPKPGKRVFLEHIPFIWKHLSFTKKVTVRNLLRYKKRFFMTVIGIAGCTGLLLTGFGLRDSIQDIIGKQYEDICQYNMTASLKDGKALQEPALRAVLDDTGKVESFLPVHQENGEVTVDDTTKDVTLFVPERTADLPQFIHLQNRKTGEALAFTEDQVVLTEKLAEQLGVRAGSSITIKNADGKAASATVSGVTENYLYSYAYMSPTLYTSLYGDIPEYATVLGILTDASSQARDTLSKTLLEIDDVSSVQFTTDLSSSFADVISNIDYIVIVLIISAGLLAFVVLYNLTNINITERQKEIATIKVLGFHNREVSAYVYRETLLLSLIGTAAGLVFGIFLHAFVVKTAEVDMVMFGRTIKWTSYIFAAVLTMLFSALVNLVMYRKLKAVDMVESMKAGE